MDLVARRGTGKLRHVKLALLWLQQQKEADVEQGPVKIFRIAGVDHKAHFLTKPVLRPLLDRCLVNMAYERRRPEGSAGGS